jgi:hypothetical protein
LTIIDPKIRVPIVLDMLFPQAWLIEKAKDDAAGRTNEEVEAEVSI